MPFGEYELSPSLIGLSLLHSPHPEAFQRLLVRTSIPCYRDFILDKCRSLGFASTADDSPPSSDSLSLRLGASLPLTWPTTVTRRFIMQKARRHSLPCSGCFSPFLHSTGSLSVSYEYLALPDGPGRFTQDSSCPALLRIPLRFVSLRIQDCHFLRCHFPETSSHEISSDVAVLLPRPCRNRGGLGSSPFARHYWGNHCYFLFLQVLRCFSSLRSPLTLVR